MYSIDEQLESIRLALLFRSPEDSRYFPDQRPMDECPECKKQMVLKVEEGLYVCADCHTTRRYVNVMEEHKDTELHAQDAFVNHALRTRKV